MQLDWLTFALEIVNFLVLIWILQHFLYKPVLETIARRKAVIEKTLADAGAQQAAAQTLERQYRERLSDWDKEKETLRARALESVNAERGQRMAELGRDLDEEREKRGVVEEHRAAMLANRLEEEAATHGAQFAARLLARVATPETERQLATVALEDLARLPPDKMRALKAACRDAGRELKVTSAFALPEPQRRAIGQALRAATGEDVSVEFRQDPKLLAGLRIGAGPLVLDASLQNELKLFTEAAGREA